MKNNIYIFLFLIIVSSINLFSQVTQEWVFKYPQCRQMLNLVKIIDCDKQGNVYITNRRYTGNFTGDIVTIKIASNGDTVWSRVYKDPDSSKSGESTAIRVDSHGNIYVGGCSFEGSVWGPGDFLLLKYDSNGMLLWERKYDGPAHHSDFIKSIVLDKQDNIIVTGPSLGNGVYDFCTIKYSPSGDSLWTQRYDGPGSFDDFAEAVAVDLNNDVYVTGESCTYNYYLYDYATIKYSSDGTLRWVRRYNSPSNYDDQPFDIICDDSNNVYVTGSSYDQNSRSATIKYNTNGDTQWISKSSGIGYSLGLDSMHNVYVTGYGYNYGSDVDIITVKFNILGQLEWTRTYNGPVNDEDRAYSIAVSKMGDVYVTGYSTYDTVSSYPAQWVTIKYNTLGQQKWIVSYRNGDGSYNLPKQVIYDNGIVYVVGYGNNNLVAVKYDDIIGIQPISSEVPNKFSLSQNYPNPFNPVTKIKFSIPPSRGVRGVTKITIYDVLGREVAVLINEVEWSAVGGGSNYPSGVYFYKLISETYSDTKRMVLIK